MMLGDDKMATEFIVKVRLSWGEEREYLVANDVEPGLAHRLATRKNWQEVMRNALLNVPVGPYLPSGKVNPPMATAKVLDVKAVDAKDIKEKLQRTRSQFIMADIWQKQSSAANYNYLHHDFDKESQEQIKADIGYWVDGKKDPKTVQLTKKRIAAQKKLLAKELSKNG